MTEWTTIERPGGQSLLWRPALEHRDLLAAAVVTALERGDLGRHEVLIAEIDTGLADTGAFCEAYGVRPEESANCVVILGRRGEDARYAACMVLATTRADVNGVVRRRLGTRKASFAPMDDATLRSGMEFGGITPVGLPADWPVLVDEAVAHTEMVVIGSGVRRSKLALPGAALASLPSAEVVRDLAR